MSGLIGVGKSVKFLALAPLLILFDKVSTAARKKLASRWQKRQQIGAILEIKFFHTKKNCFSFVIPLCGEQRLQTKSYVKIKVKDFEH